MCVCALMGTHTNCVCSGTHAQERQRGTFSSGGFPACGGLVCALLHARKLLAGQVLPGFRLRLQGKTLLSTGCRYILCAHACGWDSHTLPQSSASPCCALKHGKPTLDAACSASSWPCRAASRSATARSCARASAPLCTAGSAHTCTRTSGSLHLLCSAATDSNLGHASSCIHVEQM